MSQLEFGVRGPLEILEVHHGCSDKKQTAHGYDLCFSLSGGQVLQFYSSGIAHTYLPVGTMCEIFLILWRSQGMGVHSPKLTWKPI